MSETCDSNYCEIHNIDCKIRSDLSLKNQSLGCRCRSRMLPTSTSQSSPVAVPLIPGDWDPSLLMSSSKLPRYALSILVASLVCLNSTHALTSQFSDNSRLWFSHSEPASRLTISIALLVYRSCIYVLASFSDSGLAFLI